jgi:hypothetical protein
MDAFSPLLIVKQVLTHVIGVVGGGSRRVTKWPAGCLLVVNLSGIVNSVQTSRSRARSSSLPSLLHLPVRIHPAIPGPRFSVTLVAAYDAFIDDTGGDPKSDGRPRIGLDGKPRWRLFEPDMDETAISGHNSRSRRELTARRRQQAWPGPQGGRFAPSALGMCDAGRVRRAGGHTPGRADQPEIPTHRDVPAPSVRVPRRVRTHASDHTRRPRRRRLHPETITTEERPPPLAEHAQTEQLNTFLRFPLERVRNRTALAW